MFISVHDPDLLNGQLEDLAAAELDGLAHRDRDADDRGVVGVGVGEGDVDEVAADDGLVGADDLDELAAVLPGEGDTSGDSDFQTEDRTRAAWQALNGSGREASLTTHFIKMLLIIYL